MVSQKSVIKNMEASNEQGDDGAKPINQLYHWPSRSKYTACLLTSTEMKNQAFALLYQEYIGNAKSPWDIQPGNPSNIRVEKRLVDGRKDVPVLVDDFEHNSRIVGLFSEPSDSSVGGKKLVGTVRLLLRNEMHGGKLEVERYDTLPPKMKESIENNCYVELNRLAVDRTTMKGKKVGIFLTHAILAETFGHGTLIGSNTRDIFYSIQQGFNQRVHRNRFNIGLMFHDFLGSFKYEEKDPYPVDCFINSCQGIALTSLFYSLSGGSIPLGIGMMPFYKRMKIDTASLLRTFMIVVAFHTVLVVLVLKDRNPVLMHPFMTLGSTLSTCMLQTSVSHPVTA